MNSAYHAVLITTRTALETLDQTIAGVWHNREDRYSEIRTANTAELRKIEMSYIGG